MTNLYDELHCLFNSTKRFHFPFDNEFSEIPLNGIYILFEAGEKYKQWDRIVRIGTHTGKNQLHSRLKQHFINENKNRSIFRKNIGRCIINRDNSDYLKIWNFDTTSVENQIKYVHLIDQDYEKEIEKQISAYLQTNLSFTIFEVNNKEDRIYWESKIISTLASFNEIQISEEWLGRYSPLEKIRNFGLWQVNELHKEPVNNLEFKVLQELVKYQ